MQWPRLGRRSHTACSNFLELQTRAEPPRAFRASPIGYGAYVRHKLLHENQGLRTFALVMDKGDDPIEQIIGFAAAERITAASLTGIGACRGATLGYFDPGTSDYQTRRFDEQLELLSFIADVATKDDKPALHAHVVLGRDDFSTIGGHLVGAEVYPTMEVVVIETPSHLRKRIDADTGLALIALSDPSAESD